MPLNWMDVSTLTFNHLLLLERVQIRWLFDSLSISGDEWALALAANPTVEWFLRRKNPDAAIFISSLPEFDISDPDRVRPAELAILAEAEDFLVYALEPEIYASQPFLGWDSAELTDLVDFAGKTVIDVGAGTGRQTFVAAPAAAAVFAVEPVENLRHYLRKESDRRGLGNVYPVDGLITEIPFPDDFADVVMGGHVFGDDPEAELAELERVARPGAMIILIPGSADRDTTEHRALVSAGFAWARFDQPGDGLKRKYWKEMP